MLNKLIILLFLIVFPINVEADSLDSCIQACISDVISIESCMKEEKNYWDAPKSFNYKRACRELIKNEREYCIQDCYNGALEDEFSLFDD